MNKKETSNPKLTRKQNYEEKKMNNSKISNKKKDKELPWWVELLFVQIGLPDGLLIKILKAKKKSKEFIHNEKNTFKLFISLLILLVYFYPVIRNAKNMLECGATAKSYILKSKKSVRFNKKELNMLSTNFCYGGYDINEIEKL